MNLRSQLAPQPIDNLQVITRRRPLSRTKQAIRNGKLTVGFIGGSITAGWDNNWPKPVMGWLAETYPNVFLVAENAAIGATGSDSACLRVDREIIQRECDITFVEYAVNDRGKDSAQRQRTQEGLIRKLLADDQDVVIVYTFCQDFYADMIDGRMPESIAALDHLAVHYSLGTVWVGLRALNDVRAGRMTWADWLPDNLHPGNRGSWSYGQAVIEFLKEELQDHSNEKTAAALPEPLAAMNWQSAHILPLTSVRTRGPWVLKRDNGVKHMDQILDTNTPGATLEFDFTGRGLALIFEYGKRSAEFKYRIDGGNWIPVERERPEWGGERSMARATVITEDLSNGPHTFEAEVIHGNRLDCTGTEFRLAVIGIL